MARVVAGLSAATSFAGGITFSLAVETVPASVFFINNAAETNIAAIMPAADMY